MVWVVLMVYLGIFEYIIAVKLDVLTNDFSNDLTGHWTGILC